MVINIQPVQICLEERGTRCSVYPVSWKVEKGSLMLGLERVRKLLSNMAETDRRIVLEYLAV